MGPQRQNFGSYELKAGTYHIRIKWRWNLLLKKISPAERFKEWVLLNFKLQEGIKILDISEIHPMHHSKYYFRLHARKEVHQFVYSQFTLQ